ncbi:MAG: HAD hydrolase family protein [Rikenellaceae bacterium]|jgi:3-deoxy-D-manno-octulosonate 8-phosphate phosphatase (KDO 8-P phosphatase)|nr:HAD hydrolase family protein [Rikenellaceae bacterium]
MGNFKEDIEHVRAFAFDVDGVFTDNKITVTPDGDFVRAYNAKDGFGLKTVVEKGYPVCVITGGKGIALLRRFEMLGVSDLHLDCFDKLPRLKAFMEKYGLRPEEVLFMGDDIPDIPAMRAVGVPVCPADASVDVKRVARYVSGFAGGEGCVRDIIEQVLRARGDWFSDDFGTTVTSA